MCFSFGRKFDSELILFAVSKKVPFSDLVNTKQESGLVTFYLHAQKAHHLEQRGREKESLAFELRFYQLSPSGIGWVCWFLYSGQRAGFWMRHFGLGSKMKASCDQLRELINIEIT